MYNNKFPAPSDVVSNIGLSPTINTAVIVTDNFDPIRLAYAMISSKNLYQCFVASSEELDNPSTYKEFRSKCEKRGICRFDILGYIKEGCFDSLMFHCNERKSTISVWFMSVTPEIPIHVKTTLSEIWQTYGSLEGGAVWTS